nr:MAG TPA: hypothetical protein [Caudoviricetes sp.]
MTNNSYIMYIRLQNLRLHSAILQPYFMYYLTYRITKTYVD